MTATNSTIDELIAKEKKGSAKRTLKYYAYSMIPIFLGLAWLIVSFWEVNNLRKTKKNLADSVIALKISKNNAELELKFTQHKIVLANYELAHPHPSKNKTEQLQSTNEAIKNLNVLPAIVYIQISDDAQLPDAKKLQLQLQGASYIAPGIENVGGKSPRVGQVRYFNDSDSLEAVTLIKILKQINPGLLVKPKPYKISSIHFRLRKYEIWFPEI